MQVSSAHPGELTANRLLLEQFRRGEADALRAVFRHYAPVVARSVRRGVRVVAAGEPLAFRGIHEEHEVERVVLDTFSRAFQQAPRENYDGITPYEAYLCRIARNLLITEARARKGAPALTDSGNVPDLLSLEPGPEEQLATTALRTDIASFVAARPELERRVYEARFSRGETQQDAARRLGLNRITVRRTETRLKEAVYRFLLRQGWVGVRKPSQEERSLP